MKTINLDQLSKELGKIPGKTHAQVKKAIQKGLEKSISDLVLASPVDTGLYASSWAFHVDEEEAVIGNYAPYAGIVEDGTRPYKPPIGPLLRWAKRVLKSDSQPPNYDSEVWALARGVQNKIEKFGITPKHVLRNELPKIIQNIRNELKHG